MPSLFVIESALSDLFDARQELIDEVAFTDEQIADKQAALDQINLAIKQYVVAEVRKVDGIAAYLRELQARQLARDLEIDRLEGLNSADAAAEERIKQICLECLNEDKQKRYEGKLGTIRRQNNGGVQPVEVKQPDLVPDTLKRATVTLSLSLWRGVVAFCAEKKYADLSLYSKSVSEPDVAAIRKTLEDGEAVPGCVLKDRGEHLRIS